MHPICVFDRILRKIYDLFALIENTLMLIEWILCQEQYQLLYKLDHFILIIDLRAGTLTPFNWWGDRPNKGGTSPSSHRWSLAEQWLWARYFGFLKLTLFFFLLPTASHCTHSGKFSTWASESQGCLVRRESLAVAMAMQCWDQHSCPLNTHSNHHCSGYYMAPQEPYLSQWQEPLKLNPTFLLRSPLCRHKVFISRSIRGLEATTGSVIMGAAFQKCGHVVLNCWGLCCTRFAIHKDHGSHQ